MNAHDTMTVVKYAHPVADRRAMSMAGRVMLSSLVAIVAPGLVLMLLMLPALISDLRSAEEWLFACFIAGVAVLVAAAHVAVLGIPYVLVLLKIGRARWLPMVLGGFAMGFLPAFCLTVLPILLEHSATEFSGSSRIALRDFMRLPLSAGGFGAFCGLIFYIMFRWLSRGGTGCSSPVSEAKTT